MWERPGMPRDRSGITPAWVRRALQAGGVDVPEIAGMSVEDVGAGAGQMGEVLRSRLTWEGAVHDLPKSVIIKLPSRSARTRRISRGMRLYKREYDFYRHVAREAPVRSPRLLYGSYDGRRDDFVLVLEDLSGMVSEDIIEGAGPDRTKSALQSIAALHGRYWNRLHRPPLSNTCEVIGTRIRVQAQIAYLAALPSTLGRFAKPFTPETRRLAEDLGPRVADFLQEMLSGPSSFVHGDYHLNNLFFGLSNGGEVAVIDWQTSGPNNPLLDVALFMSRSVRSEVRRQIEREAVEVYWEALRRAGAGGFGLEECWRHYRMSMLFSLIIMVLGAGNLGSGERLDSADFEDILRRVTTASEELDAAEFIPGRRRFVSAARAFSALSGLGYRVYRAMRR